MPILSWNEIRQSANAEESAPSLLDTRQSHLDNDATLADYLAPATCPHAVSRCYHMEQFETERERIALCLDCIIH